MGAFIRITNGIRRFVMGKKHHLCPEKREDICRTILCYAVAVRWLCKEYGKPIPTVIKLVYDAKKRRVDAKYGYERLRSLSDTEPEVRCRMWFDEIRENNL